MNKSISPETRPSIEELNRFVLDDDVAAKMMEAAREILPRLSEDQHYAVCDLDLSSVRAVPGVIGTIRIAVFTPHTLLKVERHPNSTQFLYCLQGYGETRVLRESKWESDHYGDDVEGLGGDPASLEARWHLVEQGLWHQSMGAGSKPWVLAALHTAKSVIDEYEQ